MSANLPNADPTGIRIGSDNGFRPSSHVLTDGLTDEEGGPVTQQPPVPQRPQGGTAGSAREALAAARARCCSHGVEPDHCSAAHPESEADG